jgi:hypothetical protein
MLSDATAYILAHAPAIMLGDSGIVIVCLLALATGYLWHLARSHGAL